MAVANSDKMGQFFLTSTIDCKHLSSQIELSFNGSLGVFTLLNLSNSEIYGTKAQSFNTDTNSLIKRLKDCKNQTVIDIFERIVKGSCPENLNQTKDFDNTCYYQAYVNAYLQREIRFFLKVKDELLFYRFLKLVATYSAKPVIIDELAIKAEISTATAKRWLNILVATHLIALVPSFNTQKLKGKNKASYLYFLDTALLCFLLKLQDPISLLDGPMANAVFETYVFSEIYKSCINQGIEPIFSYFKTKRQSSATLLIYQEDCIYPIQIKLTASPFRDYKDKSNFLVSIEELKQLSEHSNLEINIAQGAVICMCEDVLPIDHNNNFVPLWLI